ncbi:RsmB/NOP family class I SAM-dependent RNA methyltransferase [Roseicyclus sp.]|uniref:RsmB/NOP family class I SAM-dependent RNA methyltransferase n=1 Tax=Roseicyclus sp. TaxID=1914329 RepID=UPI003F6A763F
MTPAARAAAAIAVLDDWLSGQAAEQALTNWARGARYAGSKDRAAVRDLVYDVLRARESCARLGGGGDGRALILGLTRLQGIDPETIFTGDGYAAPVLLRDELAQAVDRDGADPQHDVPAWLLDHVTQRAGDALPALLAALRMRAPLYLRVNTRKTTREDCIAHLASQGITAEAEPRAATAILVTSGARQVKSTQAYREGWIEPQDLSVQRAVLAVDWPSGPILDYCAGGGGKSLAIAALTGQRMWAHDAAPRRMADLPIRAARAGAAIDLLGRDALHQTGPFAAVLCDVPCSGSGTWRRDPEAKWRLTPARLAELVALQAEILDAAMALVAPGGQLVYMTCSLFHAENEAQIAAFCARNPDWRREMEGVATPLTASDGFYHAVLRAP